MAKVEYTRGNWPRHRWPNFSHSEVACSHCGVAMIDPEVMDILQAIRRDYGNPIHITSGYRCEGHPIEAAKARPGSHWSGKAFDVAVSHGNAYAIIYLALEHGVMGIGVNQRGETGKRFVHLDWATAEDGYAHMRPSVWSY